MLSRSAPSTAATRPLGRRGRGDGPDVESDRPGRLGGRRTDRDGRQAPGPLPGGLRERLDGRRRGESDEVEAPGEGLRDALGEVGRLDGRVGRDRVDRRARRAQERRAARRGPGSSRAAARERPRFPAARTLRPELRPRNDSSGAIATRSSGNDCRSAAVVAGPMDATFGPRAPSRGSRPSSGEPTEHRVDRVRAREHDPLVLAEAFERGVERRRVRRRRDLDRGDLDDRRAALREPLHELRRLARPPRHDDPAAGEPAHAVRPRRPRR